MNCIFKYLSDRKGSISLSIVCITIFIIIFALYGFPLKAIVYPASLCFIIAFVYNTERYISSRKKSSILESTTVTQENMVSIFSQYNKQDDIGYQRIIQLLLSENSKLITQNYRNKEDTLDYYTLWVHQIKTPIAAIDLTLQNQDTNISRKISEDLFRIHQYVDMALNYQRLDSLETDYLFKKCSLDDMIRESLRKFAPLFINKNIKLNFSMLDREIITDEKWFTFMFEQLLTNAIKYTLPKGEISVYLKNRNILCLKDTGIGIDAQDLPRIFEKGYTGFNGRKDKFASGLGLYLCKRINDNLGQEIKIISDSKNGTIVELLLPENENGYD